MNHESNVLDPDRKVELSNGSEITVKELRWRDALKFYSQIASRGKLFLDDKGAPKFDLAKLTDLIQQADELSCWLIMQCTNMDKASVDVLRVEDAFHLLDICLELNLNMEVFEKAKKPAARFALALGVKRADPIQTNHSRPESTSSSGKDTHIGP